MELPKIEDFKVNLNWLFTFFVVGYFALYSLFETYFLNYDIITRIILSVIASYLLFLIYIPFSSMAFFRFYNKYTEKYTEQLKGTAIKIDVESETAVFLNIALFVMFKILFIFEILQYNLIHLLIIFFIIMGLEPLIGLIDGYSIYTREAGKLKTELEFNNLNIK